jgi:hypothetical protein
MMEKYTILKLKKKNSILEKKKIIHFVNVETGPRPWYGFGQLLNWY